ncbi:hypothetical protein DFA_05951 [Cavenderia fasciculata]|uniref:Uncharacterized protein n=1 Tax=Cavenderia fasciculata TaxID=261658 RepID=F4PJP1_CACFS|nr:uncharacterized protein DFA_05951 [Cavenderia fasciculata]EGG23815.1 hypothetical protein DFA_05951 [Cavenderia fasciculata]|eukprot:XP_004361666.1 hypothetical protein DFA_05951 [Cavenderia fasciculata]
MHHHFINAIMEVLEWTILVYVLLDIKEINVKNTTFKCTSALDVWRPLQVDVGPLCCWSKQREIQNIKELEHSNWMTSLQMLNQQELKK